MRRSQGWTRAVAGIVAAALAASLIASAVAGRFPLWLRSPAHAAAPPAAGVGSRHAATPGAATPDRVAGAPSMPLPRLSPQQMAGQRVIYSYSGLEPPARLLNLISHGEAAGVIFFGQNIASPAQLTAVIAELERADASPLNPVRAPLLLMTDQEGGVVRRMAGAPFQSARQIGAAADPPGAAADAGSNGGRNLRGVGMNVNLAPVLDVYRQPGDFDDQNQRSYSTDPAVVSQLGADFITAQQRVGVAATAKHFPGLGAAETLQNTDKQPVTLDVPLATLRNTDEMPYKAAIAAGVRLVMVSWAAYPALDSRPAGLSPTIVDGELRQRLGFQGVTITDALEAGALRGYGPIQHRALLAAEAGMDLLLCSRRDVAEGQQATAGLQRGYLDGTLNKQAFTAAVQRVVALRASLGHAP